MDRWQTFNNFVYFTLKLMYINVLWIAFSLVGLVVFSLFPATGAMFSTTKKLIEKEKDLRIFHTFWHRFRKDFFMLNGLFLLFLFISYFLYFDIQFLEANPGKLQFLFPIVILIGISYIVTLLFFFPVFIHFKLTFFQNIKQAFLIAITNIKELILILLTAAIIGTITYFLPGIIPLFPGSVFAYVSIKLSHQAFEKIKLRKNII